MSEEKNSGYGKHPDMVKLARELSNVTNSVGKVGFAITFTATEGNLTINEDFQKFCFEHTNNEYLAGIKLLLERSKTFDMFLELESRIKVLEFRVGELNGLQERETQGKGQEIKTF